MSFGGFIQANTHAIVQIGPVVDFSNGYVPVTSLTLTGADEAEMLKHDATATTDIKSNTWSAIASVDGHYNLHLSTTDTNTEGRLSVVIQDDSVCLPVRMDFMVLSQAAWNSIYGAKDTGWMNINANSISEDTAAADNAESFFDGTGYAGTNNVIPSVTTVTTCNELGAGAVSDVWAAALAVQIDANVSTVKDTTSAVQTQVNKMNFSGTDIKATLDGETVTVGTNNDKTGYALTATTGLGNQTANITGNITGSVGSVTGAVGSVTSPVTVGTNSDKTGYSLTATTGLGNQTANITGNLSGSVGSVTGAVGSVSGNVTGSVGSVATGGITAASIADNAIDLATFAADCKTGSALKANVETVTNGAITAAAIAQNAIDADALTDDAVDAILDEVVEGTYTVRQLLRLMASALVGKVSGGGTATITFKGVDTTTDRIVATVDADGNRTAITLTET